ncbi:MAG: 3'-5' exonuclease [Cyanobacteria bacterium M5B4]|nr:3'-5' exonuclease [Cyanobacteria bacterium KgW148]PLS69615.1 MAG: 3'-5' exonuclease [Cyanobacteria bacterium M5B4]
MRAQECLAYYQALSRSEFTVVDLETTGCRHPHDRVIEVAILQGSLTRGILHQESHLINPGIPIPHKIQKFTGITTAMVKDAPKPLSVWTQCLPLLSQGTLTAHNLSFDYGFLQKEYQRLGVKFSRPPQQQLCTVKLSRLLLADLPSRSLPMLVKHFQFPIETAHRAAPDTLACWLLLEKLFDRLLHQPDQALELFARQWITAEEVAQILDITPGEVGTYLKGSPIKQRHSRSRKAIVYLRGDVEALHPG